MYVHIFVYMCVSIYICIYIYIYICLSLYIYAGVNNLFEQEAQKLQEGGAKGVVGAVYYESGPFDYNGGFYYVKGTYTF